MRILLLLLFTSFFSVGQTAQTGLTGKHTRTYPTNREMPPKGLYRISTSDTKSRSGFLRITDDSLNIVEIPFYQNTAFILADSRFTDSLVLNHNLNTYEIDLNIQITEGKRSPVWNPPANTTQNIGFGKVVWDYKYQANYEIYGTSKREDVTSLFTWRIRDLNSLVVYPWKRDYFNIGGVSSIGRHNFNISIFRTR